MNARLLLVFQFAAACCLHAGDLLSGSKDVLVPPSPSPFHGWEIGLGAAPILGAEAEFTGLGQWTSPFAVPPLTGTADRFYDNGSNRIDNTGNANNLTSYWSYNDAAQYDPSGTGSIAMSIYNSGGTGSVTEDEVGWGGELFAYKSYGALNIPFAPGATWGLRLGLHVNHFSFDNSSTLSTVVDATTDSYDLGNAMAPASPFTGSPLGFGNAVLGDQPVRTLSTQTATASGSREFDATLFGLTAGPYADLPLANEFSLRVEAGAALAFAHGEYSHTSTTAITGAPSQTTRASSSESTLLPGLFAGVSAVYQLRPEVQLHGGIRYQYYDRFDVGAGGSRAELDFSSAFLLTLGASVRF